VARQKEPPRLPNNELFENRPDLASAGQEVRDVLDYDRLNPDRRIRPAQMEDVSKYHQERLGQHLETAITLVDRPEANAYWVRSDLSAWPASFQIYHFPVARKS